MPSNDNHLSTSFLLLLVLINVCLLWDEVGGPTDTADQGVRRIYITDREGGSGFHVLGSNENLCNYISRRWPQTAPMLTESCRQVKIEEGYALRLTTKGKAGKVYCDITPMPEKYRFLIGLPLNVNRADKDELCLLPGIGARLADKIIDTRERKGPFASANELLEVSGIGQKLLSRLHNRLTF